MNMALNCPVRDNISVEKNNPTLTECPDKDIIPSKRSVIIVAGGSGIRMGSDIPKQFLIMNGKPVLFYSIEQFYKFDNSIKIIVVLPENHIVRWQQICKDYNFSIPHEITKGGIERFYSVKNALKIVSEKYNDVEQIAVHDGVRPLVSVNLIELCFKEAEKYQAVVPAIKPSETVRYGNTTTNSIINRDEIFLIQTPQVFEAKVLIEAYKSDFDKKFTDDASVVEHFGCKIKLIEGEKDNIKITHKSDISFCEFFTSSESDIIRKGFNHLQ